MKGLAGGNTQNIGELIAQISRTINGEQREVYSVVGTVTEIQEDERTITVEPNNGDAAIIGARLQASENLDTGIVFFPKVDSEVTVTFLNEYTGIVTGMSEIDSIAIQNDTESLKSILNDLITAIRQMTVTTPSGPSTLPIINDAQFAAVNDKINNLFKQ